MSEVPRLPLEPLPYHKDMVRHLQTHEADLWRWFAADRVRDSENEAARLDLLKSTYRIDRSADAPLYAAADEVAAKFGVQAPVTFYQSHGVAGLNVGLIYMPGEVHVVLNGQVAAALTPAELRAVLGHELLHFCLLDRWREYLVASQLLAAMANDVAAAPSHIMSIRLFSLYGEVYCDRGGYLATGDLAATVSALVKIETGATEVSAESYLRQTEEIFSKGHPKTQGVTHPETFIRAKAIGLWVQEPQRAATEIGQIIQGPPAISELDFLGQVRTTALTRRLIEAFLRPNWLRTDPMLAHARLFFDDFAAKPAADAALAADLRAGDAKMHDYYCYVLLDFAVADRDLEEAPLAAALVLGDELGLGDRFRQLAVKELHLRKKQLEALDADAHRIVARAGESGDEA